jgi:hypothetical protein
MKTFASPHHAPATFVLPLMLALAGCPKDKPEGAPPPAPTPVPSASATAAVCAAGGGTIADPSLAAAFPRTLNGYCLDPHGELRLFGENAPRPIDAICTEAFDGECEVYKSFGLRRVAIFRYVDGAGSPGTVDVVVSQYGGSDGAYGMFTKRVVSDGDPARGDAPKQMKVDGEGAAGVGTAWLWKGSLFVELTYTNEKQTPEQVASTSAPLLEAMAAAITRRLPGSASLPAAVSRLPQAQRLPLGVMFQPSDAFDVEGGGAGAIGFYRDGDKRYRILSIVRSDADQAKDVLKSLQRRKGATGEKDIGEGAVRLMVGDDASSRAEWIVARKGAQVFGIGDEPLALQATMSNTERDKVTLTRDEKVKRLRALLDTAK